MALFGKKKADPALDATGPKTVDDRLDALGKTIDDMSKTMEAVVRQSQRLSGVVTTLTAGPKRPDAKGDDKAGGGLKVNTEGLPDPNLDPDGFSAELMKRVNDSFTATIAAMSKAATDQGAAADQRREFYQDLSDDFDTKYPDLVDADDDDTAKAEAVKAASVKIIRRLERRGLDAERHIATDPDGFMEQVAELARSTMKATDKGNAEKGDDKDQIVDPFALSMPDPERAMVMGGDAAHGSTATVGDKKAAKPDVSLQGMLRSEQQRLRLV